MDFKAKDTSLSKEQVEGKKENVKIDKILCIWYRNMKHLQGKDLRNWQWLRFYNSFPPKKAILFKM